MRLLSNYFDHLLELLHITYFTAILQFLFSEVDSFSWTSNTANIFAFCRLSKWNQMFIIYSLLLTGLAYRGEVDIFSGVCLFVCQSVCLSYDNFRTIKHRMTKLGGWVYCTNISHEFECQGQRSKVTGDKRKRKSAAYCSGVVLWGAVLPGMFFGSGPRGARSTTPVGKSAHAV